ncbi:ABC transporter substrate-binding protein [Haloferax sp. Atlit-4N]|uniref:ABC transporter substrate-binding protein n=1 Tax=Haloferax sp. Atlit-4N TaxID=2077206 RepID=UPI001314E976|nr:ABC transporter substrate-binding protein [Haloferax sp. Atlit-4N]
MTEDRLDDDNKTRITKYNDEFTWHDGKTVTAEDMFLLEEINYKLEKLDPDTEPQQIPEMVDKQTIKRVQTKETREDYFFSSGARGSAFPKYDRDLIRPWHEKIMDATTDSELQSIIDEATNPENKVSVSDRIGHSMWQVDTVNEQSVIYTKYEDHPYADQQNIEKLRINFVSGDSQKRLAIKNDQIDGFKRPPKGTTYPDGVKKFARPSISGNKWRLNWTDKHLGKRVVRRALAYLVDYTNIIANRGSGYPPALQNGMTAPGRNAWVSDSHVESLNNYGETGQLEKAAELLKSAGYSKNSDGIWADEDGDTISWRIVDVYIWDTLGPSFRSQLKQFGFEIEYDNVQNIGDFVNMSFEGPDYGQGWDFIIWHQNGGGAAANHPHGYYRSAWHSYMIHEGLDDEGEPTEFGFAGHPNEYEVPTEVGDMEASGETKTLNLWENYKALLSPKTSDEELRSITEKLSWWWNYEIPALQSVEYQKRWSGDSKNFNPVDYSHDGTENGHHVLNSLSVSFDRGWYHSNVK